MHTPERRSPFVPLIPTKRFSPTSIMRSRHFPRVSNSVAPALHALRLRGSPSWTRIQLDMLTWACAQRSSPRPF